jgi:hypothetical protein
MKTTALFTQILLSLLVLHISAARKTTTSHSLSIQTDGMAILICLALTFPIVMEI